jgi:hypothetical protein
MSSPAHPLALLLSAAAAGSFPAADGTVQVLPPDGDVHAVVAFSAHTVLLSNRSPTDVADRGLDAYGGSMHPSNLVWLAAEREIGSLDVVLARRATDGDDSGMARIDDVDHPRVARALRHRSDVTVVGDERGLVTLGRGLVGRWELSVELLPDAAHSRGSGRALIAAGLAMAPAGDWVWAQVAAGNTASLRAFLAAGFVPVCSEVLFSLHAD